MTSASGKSCYRSARSRAPGGKRRAKRAAACVGLAVATAAGTLAASATVASAAPTTATSAVQAATAGVPPPDGPNQLLSSMALGLNTAPWDVIYTGGDVNTLQPLLKAANIGLLRYGGGSYADDYGWKTNSNIGNCLPNDATASFVVTSGGCATSDPLDFDQFSAQAKAVGAKSLVTVNYGSGTPAEAAAWVTDSVSTPGDTVAQWEVGNETFGCWEVNNWLAQAPENYQGYIINANSTCPQVTQGEAAGTQTLATSYAVNAKAFLQAMKKAEPSAQIGVPWEIGSDEWNNTVLGLDGSYVSFVDAHYYPFGFGGSTGGSNPTDQQVLQSLLSVPSLYAGIHAELAKYNPSARVVVGETNVSYDPTTTVCTPVGALFAAGDVLSWLAAGAESVDWWDLDNEGNTGTTCTNPDFGMFSSGSPPTPQTPYYGYQLASILAQSGAKLGTMRTSDPADVLGYRSFTPGGGEALALINTDTSAAHTVTVRTGRPPSGSLKTWTYSAGGQNATNSKIVQGTASAASLVSGFTVPPESIVILKS